jgi:internalin A
VKCLRSRPRRTTWFAIAIATLAGIVVFYVRIRSVEDFVRQQGGNVYGEFLGPQWMIDIARSVPNGKSVIRILSATDRVVANSLPLTDDNIQQLVESDSIYALYLADTKVTDAGLPHIARLKNLQVLKLDNTGVTDAGLKELRDLPSLSSLEIANPSVTDAGLKHLAGLTEITFLSLNDSSVCGPGLEHLSGMIRLETLGLARSRITDDGLAHLRDLVIGFETARQLTPIPRAPGPLAIFLDGTNISDAGLAHLSGVPIIGFLSLAGTKISDTGIARLANCPKLTALDVSNTRVSDKTLDSLAEFPALVWINVSGTQVSVEKVRAVRNAFPSIRLQSDSEPDGRPIP